MFYLLLFPALSYPDFLSAMKILDIDSLKFQNGSEAAFMNCASGWKQLIAITFLETKAEVQACWAIVNNTLLKPFKHEAEIS